MFSDVLMILRQTAPAFDHRLVGNVALLQVGSYFLETKLIGNYTLLVFPGCCTFCLYIDDDGGDGDDEDDDTKRIRSFDR